MTKDSVIDFSLVAILTLVWGSAFVLIAIALRDFSPAMIAFLRLAVAAVLVTLYLIARGAELPRTREHWLKCLALGFFGFAMPFVLVPYGQEHVNSATGAILMAFTPITTLLLANFFTHDEKLTARRTIGVLLGFLGIFILFGGDAEKVSMGVGVGALLLAAFGYAVGGIVMKYMHGFSDFSSSAGALICATFLCVPALALRGDFNVVEQLTSAGWPAIVCVIALALFPTALAAILVLILIRRRGATFTATSNYAVPVVGVVLGAVTLGDEISWNILVTLGLILTAIWMARGTNAQSPQAADLEATHER